MTATVSRIERKTSIQYGRSGDRRRPKTGSTRRSLSRPYRLLLQVGILVALVVIWQLMNELSIGPALLISSPIEVWHAAVDLYISGALVPNLLSTLHATLIALVIAAILGVVIGLGLALTPRLEQVVSPFLTALNSAPRTAFAPVFIVAFGLGQTSKIVLGVSIVIFVVISGARAGVHAAGEDLRRLMTVLDASKLQIFVKLLFPVAVPAIFAALRLGLIYALLGVVTSEMISASAGMGQLVSSYSGNFQMDYVYAVILVLIVVATILNSVAGFIESKLLWWQAPQDN